jgi:polysaccharide pyruvyl transferase WcaK-like protein
MIRSKVTMSRVLLIGYYGHHNTGDDAFLAVSAWGGSHLFGHHDIMATTGAPVNLYGYPIQPIYGHQWFPRQNAIRAYLLASRADQVIFGGGSNFHSRVTVDEWCRWLDRAGPGNHLAVGVSIGPFLDKGAEASCARLLSRLAYVGVRDAASYERAVKLACGTPVEFTFDIAPLLPLAANTPLPSGQQQRKGFGVALCNYERFTHGDHANEAHRITQVAPAIRQVAKSGELDEVVLIDFNGDAYYGDHDVHRSLLDQLGDNIPVRHISYSSDPMDALKIIAGLRGIIAMRLHAAVFAYSTGTPTLMLAYHEKCHEWARTVGVDPSLVFNAYQINVEALAEGITGILSGACPLPALPTDHAVERAMRNWVR